MNKLKIEYIKPEKLILNERNPRIHPDSLIEKPEARAEFMKFINGR